MFFKLIHRPIAVLVVGVFGEPLQRVPRVDEAQRPDSRTGLLRLAGESFELGRIACELRQPDLEQATMERSSGQFVRHIKLPESVKKYAIKAEFNDGVLGVILPKVMQSTGNAG